MSHFVKRSSIAGMALAIALGTGAANALPAVSGANAISTQAETLRADDFIQVHRRHRHRGGINPGAAFALGTIGLIAGAAAVNTYRCDPYYEYCGPRRRVYYEPAPRYYAPPPRYYRHHPYW